MKAGFLTLTVRKPAFCVIKQSENTKAAQAALAKV